MKGKKWLQRLSLTLYHSSSHCAGSHRANPRRGHDHEHHWRSPHLRNHHQLHHVLPRAGRVLVASIHLMWAIFRIGNGVSVKHRRMSRYWEKPVYSYVSSVIRFSYPNPNDSGAVPIRCVADPECQRRRESGSRLPLTISQSSPSESSPP